MMRKRISKTLAVLLAASLTVGNVMPAGAAAKKGLSMTKIQLKIGAKKKIKLSGEKKKPKWKIIKGKKNISMKQKGKYVVWITAKKKGKAKVQAVVGKKKYVCVINVKANKKNQSTKAPAGKVSQAPTKVTASAVPAPTTDVTQTPVVSAPVTTVPDSKPSGTPDVRNTEIPKETTAQTAKPTQQPYDASGKYLPDVETLRALIKNVNQDGQHVSEDLDNKEYTWDTTGRLTGISWSKTSIKGKVSFRGLSELMEIDCSANKITDIDVSENKKLLILKCYQNQLEELEVNSCKELTELDCQSNKITTLKLNQENLMLLYCQSNKLKELNVTKCPALQILYCYSNNLKKLNITGCAQLNDADAHNNEDFNDEGFECGQNDSLTKLNLAGASIYTWDYAIPSLKELDCSETSIDLFRYQNMEGLEVLNLDNTSLTGFTVSKLPNLRELNLANLEIDKIDISNNGYLKKLNISYANLESVNLQSDSLEELTCSGIDVSGNVDFSGLPSLKILDCSLASFEKINLLENPKLEKLYCQDLDLENLDVSANENLKILNCSGNYLQTLKVDNSKLEELYCNDNDLTSLDITEAGTLKILQCIGNPKLQGLDISRNMQLEKISCPVELQGKLDTTGHEGLEVEYKDSTDE